MKQNLKVKITIVVHLFIPKDISFLISPTKKKKKKKKHDEVEPSFFFFARGYKNNIINEKTITTFFITNANTIIITII